ncbi:MAG: hypothetical protein HC895_00985 [Leptolyngbyaceae cyanobacterium SM1_3_5]|nr:hypothetical protein [Leptolyngbyaceae cyanobacterium SM1_3_5]
MMSGENLALNAEEIFLELDRQEAIDDFDIEVARTRQNEKLMALLDERAKQTQPVSIDEVKRRLGLDS